MDTPTPEIQELATKMRGTISRVLSQLSDPIDEDALAEQIKNLLVTERRGMILKLLGINTRFGEVEIDRQGGMFKSFMEQRATPLVEKYLVENILPLLENQLELNKFVPTKTMQQQAIRDFKRIFEWKFQQHIKDLAEKAAKEHAETVFIQLKTALGHGT